MKQVYLKATILGLTLLTAACADSSRGRTGGVTEVGGSNTSTVQAAAGSSGQSAQVGTPVAIAPAVVVRNGNGAGMPGVSVRFTVTAGGGSVANATVSTNAQGIASAGTWTLGSSPGSNVVQASVTGFNTVTFTATATSGTPSGSSAYSIVTRYVGTASTRQQQAVSNAVARWQSVITRDLSNIPLNAAANSCWDGQPAINETIDDIVIYVEFVEIDGAGKVLGEAGPCYVRTDNSLPILGHLKLDAADLRMMEQQGSLDDVVLHEIGHVLGIGTLWPSKNLLNGAGTDDPGFTGANAISAYRTIGGTAAFVPVENTGGEGTRDGHWRETIFGDELMTGWVSNNANPLSAMTIASLTDLGYGANTSAASTYTMSNRTGSAHVQIQLGGREVMRRPKYKVDRQGNKFKADL